MRGRHKQRGEEGTDPINDQTHSKVIKVVRPVFQLFVGPTLQSAIIICCIESTTRELQADVRTAFYVPYLKKKTLPSAL